MRLPTCLLSLALAACAHVTPTPGSDEEGERRAALFLKAMRWESARASGALVAPELQREYLDKVKAGKLDDKLKVTEFETKEASRLSPEAMVVAAELSWYVEPEVTVHHETITIHLRYRGAWVVDGVEGGPIPLAQLAPPAVDGGSP